MSRRKKILLLVLLLVLLLGGGFCYINPQPCNVATSAR